MSDRLDRRIREAEDLCQMLNLYPVDKTWISQVTIEYQIPRVVIRLMCPQSVNGCTVGALTVSPGTTPNGCLRYLVHLLNEDGYRIPQPSLGYLTAREGQVFSDYESLRAEIERIV